MKERIQMVILGFIVFSAPISIIIGLMDGAIELENPCQYKSILARINVPYMIGCELTKPRFNTE